MNPLDFDQDILNRCAFSISAASSSIADAGDVKQIMYEQLLVFDEELLPEDCWDDKRWAFAWAKNKTKREIESRRWMNSSKGTFEHISIDKIEHALAGELADDLASMDIKTIRGLVSEEGWELLRMRHYEGLSWIEMAVRLGITRQGVNARHEKIMAKIRKRLATLERPKQQPGDR